MLLAPACCYSCYAAAPRHHVAYVQHVSLDSIEEDMPHTHLDPSVADWQWVLMVSRCSVAFTLAQNASGACVLVVVAKSTKMSRLA